MKKAFTIIICAVLFAITGNVQAQNLKIGYIDSQEFLTLMPERDSAQKKIEAEALELQEQMEVMQVEYNNKLQTYLAEREGMSDAIKQVKEAELQDLQRRIQEFQSVAQERLQSTEAELLEPIIKKFQDAVDAVRKEQKIDIVFDKNQFLSYSDRLTDMTDLVKAKLNIE